MNTPSFEELPVPKSIEEWRKIIAVANELSTQSLEEKRRVFSLKEERQTIAGITTYSVAPEVIPEENRNRVLVHLHGGAYVLLGGEIAAGEAMLMAHYGKIKAVSVDYRMPPDHPFPAALDDSVAVWEEVIKTHRPENTGLFGSSAGGGLTLATVHKLKKLGIPLPGAISVGTPWADLSKTGDTWFTNEFIDGVLTTYDGLLEACARLYAGKYDLKDPLISPVYGDFEGFPPAILTSGTRDVLLSDTVRIYRRLRQAGVEARLQVFEGLSHAEYGMVINSPECRDAFREISMFFNNHLGK